jgi:predicted regulator of Ras-like GTPase activity (Roadblock/LC7/MglB family)
MFNQIFFVDTDSALGALVQHSLAAEGYEVERFASRAALERRLGEEVPHLIVVNGVDKPAAWLADAAQLQTTTPILLLADTAVPPLNVESERLTAPFTFQDLLLYVQDILYQRTLSGRRPFQLSATLLDEVDEILTTLREDLRARCVILSASSGRLIKTTGLVEQGVAISLAALMSGGFSATARAAQLLGHRETFDSSLQESEGYGLYAIRLRDKLILSVAFSDQITVGLVRHCSAQTALKILELLSREPEPGAEPATSLDLDQDFLQTVNQALTDILRE